MGKGKKKSDEKKAALQARKEAKADKVAKKRLQKESKLKQQESGVSVEEDENLDELLELYRKKDIEVNTTILETLEGFPPPRANGTLTYCDDKNGHLFMFGGEYYDGIENIVLDDLLRWDVQKGEWRKLITPSPRPAPRCAHSCVYYRRALYVMGGEFATADQYHHYRDIWKFDLQSLKWEEIQPRATGTPFTARSGHTTFVWKHYMIAFGGFYEALRDTRWFNDVCVLDLQTNTWMDIPHSKLASRPEERSASNVGVFGDIAIIHGGYSKLKNPTTKGESKVHSDTWILHLKPLLQGKPPTWERLSVRSKGSSPQNRSGTASATHKNRMLVFGGVVDQELHHHKITSVFYSDLFAFDMERRKWFPLRAKPQNEGGKTRRRRRKEGDYQTSTEAEVMQDADKDDDDELSDLEEEAEGGENAAASGWDLTMLRSNMFAFIDGDGNIVYEKIEDDEEKKGEEAANDLGETKEEEEEEKEEEKQPEEEKTEREPSSTDIKGGKAEAAVVATSEVMIMNDETGTPEAVARSEPLPRINACMTIRANVLYIYGGLLEVGDREITLDDCWAFDLRKRDKWECLWTGTMYKQVWRGALHDDDDSYISAGTGGDDDEDGDEDDDEDGMDENENAENHELGEAKAARKAKKEKSKRAGLRHEIAELKERLNLDDADRTPQMGEAMADFYSRTSAFWTQQAASAIAKEGKHQNEVLSNKELKREGFVLAQKRYEELKPMLDRLNELELQQREAEEERKVRKSDKKDKKKSARK